MADKIKVELNRAAVRALLRSMAVLAELEQRARAIAASAGPGMEVDSALSPNRARASVRTATPEAARAEAGERRLTKAIDAGKQ